MTKVKKLLRLRCKRCKGSWVPTKLNPASCALCRSRYWDKPRIRKNDVALKIIAKKIQATLVDNKTNYTLEKHVDDYHLAIQFDKKGNYQTTTIQKLHDNK